MSYEVIKEWKEKNLKNFLEKKGNSIIIGNKTHILDNNSISHIEDWLKSSDADRHRKRLFRLSVPDALKLSLLWTEKLNKQFKKNKDKNIEMEGVDSILELSNGFSIVKLNSSYSYLREGAEMNHCVGGYFGKESTIYSLRDIENNPHCTIEVNNSEIRQIKGKGNQKVSDKYKDYIVHFLNNLDWESISQYELENIDSFSFGNYIFRNGARMPMKLIINKRTEVISQKIERPLNNLEINGDLILNHVWGQQILADEIIVNGDLLLNDIRGMLRVANKITVLGDVEVVDCQQLKILAKEVKVIGNVLVEDCRQFIQKINCEGELEVNNCPLIKL